MAKKQTTFKRTYCKLCDTDTVFIVYPDKTVCTVCGYEKHFTNRKRKHYEKED